MLNSDPHDEVPGEQEQEEETHEDTKPQEGEQVKLGDEQDHEAPVHQGQPEI